MIFTATRQGTLLVKYIKLTRADNSSSEFDQILMLRLKTSKTDINHTGLLIVFQIPHQQNFPKTSFCKLSLKDSKIADAILIS